MTADTTTMVTMRDAAYPFPAEPSTAAELVYFGGDTPNPLPLDQGTARYRVPAWVRSDPAQVIASDDAYAALGVLQRYRVPVGVVVVLDLETAVDDLYVSVFGSVLGHAGYVIWPYGSTSTLFMNRPLGGYFVADPTGTPHLYPHPFVVATQYLDAGTYDLSVIASGAPLWDTQPPPVPVPAPIGEEVTMFVCEKSAGVAAQGFYLIRDAGPAEYIAVWADVVTLMGVCHQTGNAPILTDQFVMSLK